MSDVTMDLAWAAGLFEGEGCFAMSRYSNSVHLRARMVMTDEEPLQRFAQVVAFGGVTGPHEPQKSHWRPYWVWQATGRSVIAVFALLEPHLCQRRRGRFYELRDERNDFNRNKKRQLELLPEPQSAEPGLLKQFQLIVAYLERVESHYSPP